MAYKMPLFVSAPRCKIMMAGQEIAYAVGLSLGVTVNVEPVKTLGFYTIRSIEPLMVNPVRGTLQIVRLLSEDTRANNVAAVNNPTNRYKSSFLGIKDSSETLQVKPAIAGTQESMLKQSVMYRHLDMLSVLFSQTLDMEIYLKVPVLKDSDFTNGLLNPNEYDLMPTFFAKIQDVRLTGGSGTLSPSTIYRETFSYEGLLVVTHTGSEAQELDNSWPESPNSV